MTTATLSLSELTAAATGAAAIAAAASDAERAGWLTAVADALDANVAELVEIADSETSLGTVRLTGEVARTSGQLRLFARVITEGSYLEAVIDHADPSATPPKPDLRRILRPIGPVAVFSASNFPFAFSVAGGDTASALAVGSSVIVKAHSGHLKLSERTAEVVTEALRSVGAPEGLFALVAGREVGTALVQDPAIKAVGFTGSIPGGRALFDLAVSRPDPIPFYGELGSLNPVVITAAALAERSGQLAAGLAASFTMGAGQFCTKPGLVFIPAGTGFAAELAEASKDKPTAAMLTTRISDAYPEGLRNVAALPDVTIVSGSADQDATLDGAAPVVFSTSAANVLERPDELLEECFGPTTMLIEFSGQEELSAVLAKVPGSLTATVHAQPGEDIGDLVEQLSGLAGRVLFDGWPTGVAVNWAQQHGGPYPATTSLFTSVGATAVRRFQRPVAYQDAPETVLHPALRESNPLGIPRRVDGELRLP
ncbi:aldehyde dehydrogenase (NADP(+)) [Pseudarthrobacter sp. RMG13]|uniref:Aldehyde dehydrogenase (NADP(+)) n=1 Tax=Pseudarthrobacter humi TaxID=2952523 RepID=A0ABT1LRG9_9MICC|nr:aldehyde dehydrogenase family protein [Pseudarthrobacter humi]MCP9001060.1 aldehyde dehydrogenase (NADP(+)) [Pseudarthrobacter humi]